MRVLLRSRIRARSAGHCSVVGACRGDPGGAQRGCGEVERRLLMNSRTPALAGVDPTVVVEDHGSPTTLEAKYTVDDLGNELLLYGDAPPEQRRRDRRSVLRSRLASALPAPLRRRLARRLSSADRISRHPRPSVTGPATPEATTSTAPHATWHATAAPVAGRSDAAVWPRPSPRRCAGAWPAG